jgi:transposase-like protein
MARKRPERKNQKLLDLIREQYQPESAMDIQEALKDLTSGLLEEILKAELDEHLDYEYGEKPLGLNTRNGYNKKNVNSSNGKMEINIPRDREGSFEPQVVKKYEKDISNIESQIISMYGRGIPYPNYVYNS